MVSDRLWVALKPGAVSSCLLSGINIDLPAPLTTPSTAKEILQFNPGPAVTDKHTLTDASRHRKPQRYVSVYSQLLGLLGEQPGFPM